MKAIHFSVLLGILFVSVFCAASFGFAQSPAKHTFAIGENDFLLDSNRFQIRCGEIHAARVPAEYWQHRLRMAKAMGLNTVCAYLFWNAIEPRPGEFDWTGQGDIAQFCRIAQQEGLWVILRPGPYACAEWEMGGLPWWLLKYDDIQLRTSDPRYLDAARRYLKEVGRVLAPLQITHGGPILMVQVENEYGFYGKDTNYLAQLRQSLIDSGFDVPLFACNPTSQLKTAFLPSLFPVVNFGDNPARNFRALREILPTGPLMCGEFYPGWFDTWGASHHTGNTQRYLSDLEYMLNAGASFSIYMAHGGTTFGLWAGADRPFKPDTSTYDYDAPISEAGWPTDKFFKTRELFSKHLLPGETLPEPPAKNPVISFGAVRAGSYARLFENLPAAIKEARPYNMEKYDLAHGCILYRITIPAGPAATLEAETVHDFGFIYLSDEKGEALKRVGVMDRRSHNFKASLPERKAPMRLDVLVEAMGRVNFGQEVHDRKGMYGSVRLVSAGGAAKELEGWEVYGLPLDDKMLANLHYYDNVMALKQDGPAFWRATVEIKQPGDTFLDMRPWGKGVVWVNGHCLGRFWNIGPAQTMYVPGPWLKTGANEVIVLDLLGPEDGSSADVRHSDGTSERLRTVNCAIAGLAEPILNQLRPDLDFSRARRAEMKLTLSGVKPAHEGQFAAGTDMQEVKLAQPARGRYFCLESLSAHDGKQFAAVAELDLLDESGKSINHEGWTVAYVDSEERAREDGTAENAIDGQTANFWHTEWSISQPNHPHRLVLDLGQVRTVAGFRYVPRQGAGDVGGRIKNYRIYVGDNLVQK